MINAKKYKRFSLQWWRETGFIVALLALPIAGFCVFYIGVNFNSILLSVRQYDSSTGSFRGFTFNNFALFFKEVSSSDLMRTSIQNSAYLYIINLVTMPLPIIIAYCLWKKMPFFNVFKVILFLPSIIPGMVFIIIFKYLVEHGMPFIVNDPYFPSIITNPKTSFWVVILYGEWIGFAGGMLIYLGTMSQVNMSLVESSKLDGAGELRVLWHILFPAIYPLITIQLIGGIAGFFTNQASLYSFFGPDVHPGDYTLGYYFFIKVIAKASQAEYPYASASGLLFTAVAAPLTLLARRLFEKVGPRED